MNIPEIKFGDIIYKSHEGQGVYVHNYEKVYGCEFESYIADLKDVGFEVVKAYKLASNSFYTLKNGNDLVFAAYYPGVREMRIVEEPNSNWLEFKDNGGMPKVQSTVTQIDLEDFGLSYVIRLCDNRFIVFDGGWEFEPDADKLMKCLSEQTTEGKPVIAAWIMTHPHLDHYRCYFEFIRKYADDVTVECLMYNFPDAKESELEAIPALKTDDEIEHLPRFYKAVEAQGTPVYRIHTGQVFDIANAHMEVLASPDDTMTQPLICFNKTSLVFKMTIDGQVILWTGDSNFVETKLARRWGSYLKADIFQIPHHGFNGGRIEEFDLIDPVTVFAPVEDVDCFRTIDYYYDFNYHLMYNMNVEEIYTGSIGSVTLKLPHKPCANAKKMLLDKIEYHRKALGLKTWLFEGVTTEDCTFTFINSTRGAVVFANLIFEDGKKNVAKIKIDVPGGCVSHKNILNPNDADGDALFFNRASLKIKGVEPGSRFAVRFSSSEPIVIKWKNPADYCC
ncbi:MAG: hypothetical protein IJB70_04675 [Clostridia bacterium]|nr:hypothetical protein [Clostridia bacterium]